MAKKSVKTKTCARCGEELPMSEFYKSQSPMFKADGKCPLCKQCMIEVYEENLQ